MSRFVFLLLILAGCSPIDPVTPSPIPVVDTDLCGQMCDHLATLNCEEGQPVYNNDLAGPKDVPNQSCTDFCKELQDKGVPVNPRCVSTVKTCDEIEAARRKEPKTCEMSP